MQDVYGMVSALRRPPLLVQAARFGIDDYSRTRMLPRLLRAERIPGPAEAILGLMEIEAVAEEKRTSHAADYSVARHVEVMIALLAEVKLLRQTRLSSVSPT